MVGVILAATAAYGTFLLYTAVAYRRSGVARLSPERRRRAARSLEMWLAQAGLDDIPAREFAAVVFVLSGLGSLVGWIVFGSLPAALSFAGLFGTAPVASYRRRRERRRVAAQESWPRLIEEIRILTASAGRSIPQALFEAGSNGPDELQDAFDHARREWLLSTDFARTLHVLKHRLADPTADAACETLLVAHQVGGTDLDRRLESLSDDRRQDGQGRKDARARQAGVRFARSFTIVCPLGMAVVGLTIGDGRAAYQTPTGQLVVLVALGMMAACWAWAGRIMRLPEERRVFAT